MVTPVSAVRRSRVPIFDTPREQEPPALSATGGGPRSLAISQPGLAALSRPGSAASGLAVAPLRSEQPLDRDPVWRARPQMPVMRPESITPWSATDLMAENLPRTPQNFFEGRDRLALNRATAVLDSLPCVVFEERTLISELLPRYSHKPSSMSAGLAMEWLAAGLATADAAQRLDRLAQGLRVVDALKTQQELIVALRRLGLEPRLGATLELGDGSLTLKMRVRLTTDADVLSSGGRWLAQALIKSPHRFHLLLLTGGPLPRPVACLREEDASFSVFDPQRGVFTTGGDELQELITAFAADHERQLLRQREEGDLVEALSVLRSAQLMEVAMHGVDINNDGVRDGGLI